MQNGFCEAFNSKMRDEFLNQTLFFDVRSVRDALAAWTCDYNTARPHSALGYQTRAAYRAACGPQRADASPARGGGPHPPFAPTAHMSNNNLPTLVQPG